MDKDLPVTYTFDKLEIDVPSARGPDGKELGSAKWVIDGKVTISTASTSTSTSIHNTVSSGSSFK